MGGLAGDDSTGTAPDTLDELDKPKIIPFGGVVRLAASWWWLVETKYFVNHILFNINFDTIII